MNPVEYFYHDYLLIKEMKAPIEVRVRILSTLLSNSPNPWPVVGITEEALKTFAKHNFCKVSGMGINRSHLKDRHEIYKQMLESEFPELEEWWEFYIENDKTILSTSSENMTSSFSRVIDIDYKNGLFKNAGFAWRHNKKECNFLKDLYKREIPYQA